MAKAIVKNNKAGGITRPGITAYYEALVIKTVQLWCKEKKKHQNRRENMHIHLIYYKDDR